MATLPINKFWQGFYTLLSHLMHLKFSFYKMVFVLRTQVSILTHQCFNCLYFALLKLLLTKQLSISQLSLSKQRFFHVVYSSITALEGSASLKRLFTQSSLLLNLTACQPETIHDVCVKIMQCLFSTAMRNCSYVYY